MKKIATVCFSIFSILIFSVSCLYAQANLKIGVFDLQRIMKESKVIQAYRKTLEKEIEAKRKLFLEKQDSARLIEEKLKRDERTITADEKRRLGERLSNEIKELRRLKEDIDTELQKIDRELSQKAMREIGETIRELGRQEKYSMIFERSMAGMAYFEDAFDMTKKIIEMYDTKK